jgi:Mn2+/Fe2+ NRAMP family transporter
MKKIGNVLLGVVTSVAGYLEVGSLGTSLQAGAAFRFQLLWALALGTLCIAALTEMSGRLAAANHETVISAMREHFGFKFQVWPLSAQILIDLLVLASEVGGASLALQLVTGVSMRLWVIPVVFILWLVLWKGKFGSIEHGIAVLGIVTLSFAVAAWRLHPDWHQVAQGLVPHRPDRDAGNYVYLAVGILGASISPYLVSFYSSGGVEEKWKLEDIAPNRFSAWLGMGFGGAVGAGVVIVAALVLAPRGILAGTYQEGAVALSQPFGRWGFPLFCSALFVGCMGAALEIALDVSYITSQTFGWKWGENQLPAVEGRFPVIYTVALLLGTVPSLLGVDPLKFTMFSMSMTVVALPVIIAPLIVIMNDKRRLRKHTNHLLTNIAVVAIVLLSFVLAVIAIPAQVFGG